MPFSFFSLKKRTKIHEETPNNFPLLPTSHRISWASSKLFRAASSLALAKHILKLLIINRIYFQSILCMPDTSALSRVFCVSKRWSLYSFSLKKEIQKFRKRRKKIPSQAEDDVNKNEDEIKQKSRSPIKSSFFEFFEDDEE